MYKPVAPLSEYSVVELALMTLMNCFGTGSERRKRLGSRFTEVQIIVNQITASGYVPADGGAPEEKVRKVLEELRPTDQEYDEFIDTFINALKEV